MKIKRPNAPGVVPGELLNDQSITLCAKGLYALIESKKGEVDLDDIEIDFKSSPAKHEIFKRALGELKKAGYISIS